MASSFFGMYVQRDALQLAQKALDITGNNITNINTEGYSRQRLDICSVAYRRQTIGYNTGTQLAGMGAEAPGVTQIRDELLDAKVRKFNAELCDTGSKVTVLSDIEDVIDDVENEDGGFTAIFNKWEASFQSFSATGADRKDLANISINSAQSVINVLRNIDTRICEIAESTVTDIDHTNDRVNAILKSMAGINKQIEDGYVQMNNIIVTHEGIEAERQYGPLELKDQMNALADELSQYLNINVTEEKTGSYTISFGDKVLVYKDKYAKTDMKFTPEGDIHGTYAEMYVSSLNTQKQWDKTMRRLPDNLDDDNPSEFEYKKLIQGFNSLIDTGNVEEAFRLEEEIMSEAAKLGVKYDPIFKEHISDPKNCPEYAIEFSEETDTLTSGSLKGLFDVFNGKGFYAAPGENDYKGIKYYAETYRSLAVSLKENFNSLFSDYNAKNPTDKFEMFSFGGDGTESILNLQIAKTWKDDPIRCVHPQGTDKDDYNYDELDNSGLNNILSAFQKKYTIGSEPLQYTFGEFITNVCNTLGSELEYELSNFESTNIMYDSVCDAREEVMGVSMDEEGVNMMNYQKWYNAISRMITAMDQCLEKLINNTGVVGT